MVLKVEVRVRIKGLGVRVWAGSRGMNYDYEGPHRASTIMCVCVLANISCFQWPPFVSLSGARLRLSCV